MVDLLFSELRKKNIERVDKFVDSDGVDQCATWVPAQWYQALSGELGEYANIRKKFERGDISEKEFKILGGKELADAQTYLDILAHKLGINLAQVTIDKWNEKSVEIGSPCRLIEHKDT